MTKTFFAILLIIPMLLSAQMQSEPYKVLMVLSSYGKDSGKERPGYEFDEFSQAYLIFRNNGLSIDIASPKGGKVEADEFNKEKPYNLSMLKDASAPVSYTHLRAHET